MVRAQRSALFEHTFAAAPGSRPAPRWSGWTDGCRRTSRTSRGRALLELQATTEGALEMLAIELRPRLAKTVDGTRIGFVGARIVTS